MSDFETIGNILNEDSRCYMIDDGDECKIIELVCGSDQISLYFNVDGKFIGVGE